MAIIRVKHFLGYNPTTFLRIFRIKKGTLGIFTGTLGILIDIEEGKSSMDTDNSLGYNPSEVYERIKKLFRDHRMKDTQDEIARFLDVSQKSVAKWKNNIPGSDNLIRIATKFNVSLDWLVWGKETSQTATTQGDMKIEDICNAMIKTCKFSEIKVTNKNLEDLAQFPIGVPATISIDITPYTFEQDINECDNYRSWSNYISGDAFTLQQFLVNATLINRSGASAKLKAKQMKDIFDEIRSNVVKHENEGGFLSNVYNPHGFYEKDSMF